MKNAPLISTVSLTGDITHANSPEWSERLQTALRESRALIIDASAVNMLSSAGLRMLLLMHREATIENKQLALAALPTAVRDVMHVTGFLQHFALFATVEEAASALEARL